MKRFNKFVALVLVVGFSATASVFASGVLVVPEIMVGVQSGKFTDSVYFQQMDRGLKRSIATVSNKYDNAQQKLLDAVASVNLSDWPLVNFPGDIEVPFVLVKDKNICEKRVLLTSALKNLITALRSEQVSRTLLITDKEGFDAYVQVLEAEGKQLEALNYIAEGLARVRPNDTPAKRQENTTWGERFKIGTLVVAGTAAAYVFSPVIVASTLGATGMSIGTQVATVYASLLLPTATAVTRSVLRRGRAGQAEQKRAREEEEFDGCEDRGRAACRDEAARVSTETDSDDDMDQ